MTLTPMQLDAIRTAAYTQAQQNLAQKAQLVAQMKASGQAGQPAPGAVAAAPMPDPSAGAPPEEHKSSVKKVLLYGVLGLASLGGAWFAYKKFKKGKK